MKVSQSRPIVTKTFGLPNNFTLSPELATAHENSLTQRVNKEELLR